jgi:hypothetical protein
MTPEKRWQSWEQLFSSIYLVALCAVPFMPETRGKALPE